uniref:Uncharacterized protein LOC104249756 n=1 Tax=Nicotiana sylvestris TaxID=4096 RepID=A0A1U7YRG2_NICSY|nr:PREDICTED: uncharacterized protein LOC104249756 [Nicotiana sylvestris]
MIKDRASRKNITILTTLNGAVLTDPKSIKREIVDFYKSLIGTVATTLLVINMQILKNGPQLNHQQAMELVKDISKQEVDECLHATGNDKASRIDGYNVVFFKKAWTVIKENIYEAISEFFATDVMPKAINYTTVTLLPKITNPTNIKDYIPISCYSILYKIISNILASRLQKVTGFLIDGAQAGFIPGRK